MSQLERKARVEQLLADQPVNLPIVYSQHVIGNSQQVFDAMAAGGFEGVVGKSPIARPSSGHELGFYGVLDQVGRQLAATNSEYRRFRRRKMTGTQSFRRCVEEANNV